MDIKESYQISAIYVVKLRYHLTYFRKNEEKNVYRFPYFIRNKWVKDILIRSKERKEINEKNV